MKRFISGFLLGAILFSVIGAVAVSYIANPVDFKVLVNGQEFVSDPPALEVEGRTYLPLRAIGKALGVPVKWNEELRQAEVGSSVSDTSTSSFPANWVGKWDCVKTEWDGVINEGYELEFYDYKNKVILRWDFDSGNTSTLELWSVYNKPYIAFYYDDKLEEKYPYEFEVVKQADTQIVLNIVGIGNEIVLEKKQ